MLRITVQEDMAGTVLVLEGRLERVFVPELERAFSERLQLKDRQPIIVDLCGLTGTDESGETALHSLYERGATLRCADVMNQYLVERIIVGSGNPTESVCHGCHSSDTETT